LKKVAISQGMRLDFPDELGGMAYEYPYTDEMENSNTGIRMPQSLSGEKSESDNTEEIIGTVEVMPETEAPEPQVTEPSMKQEGEQLELKGDGNGEIDYFSAIVKKVNGMKEASRILPVMNRANKAKGDQAALKEIYEKLEV